MLKLEIRLDDGLIAKINEYTAENIYACLDKNFSKLGILKKILPDGTLVYYGTGDKQDYGGFGLMITSLHKKDWFMPYVTKWLWYNSDDGRSADDFKIQDVLYFYTKRESIA